MLGATPTLREMSAKRRRPSRTSRITSSVQRSPSTDSAAAIEQFWSLNGRNGTASLYAINLHFASASAIVREQLAKRNQPGRGQMARRWQVLIVVSVAVFMVSLDLFIVNIAFPDIERAFHHSSVAAVSWVLNAYAIVFAALLVSAGRLADRVGRRRIFLAGLVVFLVGSALCGLAPSVVTLVAARVVQAAGAACLLPTS